MAKKKAARKKATKKTTRKKSVEDEEKQNPEYSQFALRLRPELYSKLKETAETASMSMNQLIQGMCEAAIDNVHIGEAQQIGGIVSTRDVPGCVFFGDLGHGVYQGQEGEPLSEQEAAEEYGPRIFEDRAPGVDYLGRKGVVWFGLDYSGRGYRKY
ncbi:MAG: toxin-antitoxin system HicB family antitoxin [Planctomycetota bacterium]